MVQELFGLCSVPSGTEPKLMNRCRPEKKDTKEHGQRLNIILKFEEGEVLDRKARG